jgi:bifunctional non-homologous end joining protein LigD
LLPKLEAGEPLVVRVRYAGWTEDGHLRHPVYLGMRHDVHPQDVVLAPKPEDATMLDDGGATDAETNRVVGKARLTNQDKVFWPDDGISKGDLCSYYEAVAPVLLPHLRDRPVTLVRFPDGIGGKSFFQWRIPKQAPPWLRSLRLRSEETDGKEVSTILINDLSSLMYVANLGCIPLHIIASRAEALDTCDFLTLDLDVELASLEAAIPIALTIRDVLEEVGLTGFPKTSGKTGLHVLVPLGDGLPFGVAKQLLELIGRIVLQRHPEHATMERRKDKRGARVLIDVGQTGRHRTIVAPYSVREVPGAPVSTPISWDEVSLSLDPSSFNVFTVPERVLSAGDPMADAWSVELDLDETLALLGALIAPNAAT